MVELDGFSSAFTRQTGLEVVNPRIQKFAVDRQNAHTNEMVTIDWDCANNPPETQIRISLDGPSGGTAVMGLPRVGNHQFQLGEPGTYLINLAAINRLNGVDRQDVRTATVTVA